MRVFLKRPQEIAKLRACNQVVSAILDVCCAAAKPGVSTWELNEIAAKRLKQLKGESAFLGYRGYPAVLCTSVNEVVVHGIPRKDVILDDGDGAFVYWHGSPRNPQRRTSVEHLGIVPSRKSQEIPRAANGEAASSNRRCSHGNIEILRPRSPEAWPRRTRPG